MTKRSFAYTNNKKPAIIGTNRDEGVSLVAFDPNGPNMTNADIVTLGTFLCPAVQTTAYLSFQTSIISGTDMPGRNRYAVSVPTFRYLYAGNFSNISPRPWEDSYHSSELPLIFGTSGIAHAASTDFEIALSHRMQDLWLAFISDPMQGLPSQGWNAYEPGGTAVEFGKDGTLVGSIGLSELGSVCNGAVSIPGAVPPS
jgi:carboxylesterase type B